MTITKTADVEGTLAQIYALAAAGADIVRCTCNEEEAAEGLARIVPRSPVPIVADIHFQYKLALAALDAGVACLRLNPGNIRKPAQIKLVAEEAKARGVPIRIGVNAGSLDPDLYTKYGQATPEALVESAQRELAYFSEVDFHDVKISVKASNVPLMIEAYRQLSEVTDHPLHLGVTEAGLSDRKLPIQVAVMGCVVNGPGEARTADLGIAAGNGKGHLFVKGQMIRVVPEAQMVEALVEEAERLVAEGADVRLAAADADAVAETERDRQAMLAEQGDDPNAVSQRVDLIRK